MRRQPGLAFALSMLLASLALAGCLGPPPEPAREPLAPTQAPAPADDASATNLPPVANFTWAPLAPEPGDEVEFRDTSTDPDDGVAGRIWQFPDNTTSQMGRVRRTFDVAGRYLVRLVVSDRAGQTDVATQVVNVGLPPAPGGSPPPAGAPPSAPVVVAVIDTGINPYHEVFRAPATWGHPSQFLEAYPADAAPLGLTLGPAYAEARAADEGIWAGVEQGKLYYVPGTRIVGAISMGLSSFANAGENTLPVLDEDGHGTATASRVVLAGPDVLVVMVETGAQELEQAIAWAAAQPWIDVLSISIGPAFNAPTDWPWVQLGAAGQPTRDAWDQGKLVFTAAGNEPSLTTTSHLSGPPWVVSVGAAYPQGHGEPGTAARGMDIVSDYSPLCATHDSTSETEPRSGTSFGAPTAAGAVAQALHLLRARQGWQRGIEGGSLVGGDGPGLLEGGLTNAELRQAAEHVAQYWELAEWQPAAGLPIVAAPWVQMGWGYLDGADALALAEAVVTGELPAKPSEAEAYMGTLMAARRAMWG